MINNNNLFYNTLLAVMIFGYHIIYYLKYTNNILAQFIHYLLIYMKPELPDMISIITSGITGDPL